MIGPLPGAARALRAHEARLSEAADETARAAAPVEDRVTLGEASLTDATVDRITASAGFRAQLKVVQTAEEMARELTRPS